MQTENTILKLDINLLVPNKYQPRKDFDEEEIINLSESIKIYGILNPILVREKEGKYEIIAGERRFRAAKLAGLITVPVIVKPATDQEMAELALVENVQRRDLSSIEEAKSYDEILKLSNQTQEELAKKIGKSQSFIANKIRLLSLPKEIQEALINRKISERHARSLLTIENEESQIELLNKIIKEKLTVKETEQIINQKEINEDEIKQAINDIMKSLNITTEESEYENKEKEEKEDDNMNNGNFFPNYDNNFNNNNNTSLNMMNMQSMGNTQIEQQNDMVMPSTPNIVSSPMNAPTSFNEQQHINPQPMTNPFDFNIQQPVMTPQIENGFNNIPFGSQQPSGIPGFVGQPQVEPTLITPSFGPQISEPILPQESAPIMQDTPLFNPTAFEVPVTINNQIPEPVIVSEFSEEKDKFQQLKEFLTNGGYTFKTYSNNDSNCIIIELPKN